MSLLATPIEMIAVFTESGEIHPIRFRVKVKEEPIVVRIDKVLQTDESRYAGNVMKIFRCLGCVNGIRKNMEIRYEEKINKWMLFKT